MRVYSGAALLLMLLGSNLQAFDHSGKNGDATPISGFRDPAAEQEIEERYLGVPDPRLAEEHLRTLTQAPHVAGTPEDKATADYVAKIFCKEAPDTEIVE